MRPRITAIVEEGELFVNYYVHIAPVKTLQTLPTAVLKGANAQAYLTTILVGGKDAHIDVGGRIVLNKHSADVRGGYEISSSCLT